MFMGVFSNIQTSRALKHTFSIRFRLALELHRIFRYFTDPLQYFQHIIKRTSELMLVKSNRMVSR